MPRVWVRKKDSDTWHWCKNCHLYPTGSDVVKSDKKPTYGELCNHCQAKEKASNCNE
jgi:hypothetical protein